jgi:RNA polymerase sigma factor (sigma-70 family)
VAALPETARATDLYERYASRLYGFCLHRLGSREEAEDAVQTTFLNAFRGLSRGVVPASESAWLFKIAENVCLSRHRATFRRRRVEAPGDLATVEDTVAAPARADDELIPLEDALAEMPDAQRRALLLREWQGLSYREIAAELEVSQSAVETLIFRARRSLARRLEAPRERLRRVGQAIDVGAVLSALKGALSTGAVVKTAVAGVALTGFVAGIAADHPQLRRHDAPPAPAASAKQRHVARAPQRVDAPRISFAEPRVSQSVVARKAEPKHAAVSKHSAPRHVVVAPAAPRRAPAAPHMASPPAPAVESAPEASQSKAHEQQSAKSKPAGKPRSLRPAAKPKKPDAEPKAEEPEDPEPAVDQGPPAEKGQPADPGTQRQANGKNK